ncbi:anthocyanidin 3-O-glucosyltransferase-like [Panicum miliaceum]|uniref:Anthocyanidin 3-O-glucosyltransferase-like n=1 Tax=Panicum miliaceum TaxID=4540 RepID=A0A3L6Q248_PANMI|nr:anthocyanidin 3-O-glucosyltransferase-like [Panicum miliaceum]
MLAEAVGAVTVAPLDLPSVPGLPAGAASTAELSADGAELLKVALDGTRLQIAALLAEIRPDAVIFDFALPWICAVAAPLGVKLLYFNVYSTATLAFLAVPTRCPGGRHPSARDLTAAPAGFPSDSPLVTASLPSSSAAPAPS